MQASMVLPTATSHHLLPANRRQPPLTARQPPPCARGVLKGASCRRASGYLSGACEEAHSATDALGLRHALGHGDVHGARVAAPDVGVGQAAGQVDRGAPGPAPDVHDGLRGAGQPRAQELVEGRVGPHEGPGADAAVQLQDVGDGVLAGEQAPAEATVGVPDPPQAVVLAAVEAQVHRGLLHDEGLWRGMEWSLWAPSWRQTHDGPDMPLVSGKGTEFRQDSGPSHASLGNICSCRTRSSVGTSRVRCGTQ